MKVTLHLKHFGLTLVLQFLSLTIHYQIIKDNLVNPADDKPLAGAALTTLPFTYNLKNFCTAKPALDGEGRAGHPDGFFP